MSHREAHLNLVDSSQHLFALDPGAVIEAGDGWLFGAGRSPHPVISNAAFRIDDALDPTELIQRAQRFFAAHDRGFVVWARTEVEEDRDLILAAEELGLQAVYEMPEMVLNGPAEGGPPPAGTDLRRVTSAADASDYWEVAATAYASIGFPAEIFAFYERPEGLWAKNAAAFLAHLDGQPAGIAMTIVSQGVAGIYWVGSTEVARGRGLGRTLTATAVNAGLDLGATTASLQASPMGESLYGRMGFETIFDYRLFMSPPSEKSR